MRVLAWNFALIALLVARAAALDLSSLRAAAQDGDGLVWMIGSAKLSGQHVSDALFSTDGAAWRFVACPDTSTSAYAQQLATLRDGDVLCVWSSHNAQGESKLLLSRHRGDASRLFATIDLAPEIADQWTASAPVVEDSRGQLWVFNGGRLWRVGADGSAPKAMRQIGEADLTRPLGKDDKTVGGIELLEDGVGRLWIFGTGSWDDARTLRHPHVFDGTSWRVLTAIPGLPDGLIATVAVRDANRLWCARYAGGLYEIDLRSLEAQPVAEPQPAAFRSIEQLRVLGDTVFVASLAREEGMDEYEPPRALRRPAALWRHEGGKWQRLVSGDSDEFPNLDALVSVENDRLIPRRSGGFWKLAADGEAAALVNWRNGIRLSGTSRIFPISGDKLLLMDFTGHGEGRFFQIAERTPNEKPSWLETFRLRVPMIQDGAGALWQIPLGSTDRLRHHDGAAWRDIPLPKQVSAGHVARLAVDSFGRIWLLPDDTTQLAALYDREQRKWEIYKTLELAYQIHLPRRTEFRLDADWLSPRYSEDGRIAFSHPRERLHYFNGKQWSSADNLLTAQEPFRAEIRPFFNRAGRLAWNYRSFSGMITREFDEQEGWQQAEFEDNPNDPSWTDENKPPLPRGVISDKPASYVQDRLGSTWLVAGHRLHRALPGVCVPLLDENEANPFLDGRSLDQVFIAKNGDTFLLTDQYDRAEYVRVRFDVPPPETDARVVSTGPDSVQLEIQSDAAAPRWFRWRLGAGAWSDPSPETRIALEALPSGEHRCEVAALDRWLRFDQRRRWSK